LRRGNTSAILTVLYGKNQIYTDDFSFEVSPSSFMKRAAAHPCKELLLLWMLFGSLAVCAQENPPSASASTAAHYTQAEVTDSARTVNVLLAAGTLGSGDWRDSGHRSRSFHLRRKHYH